MATQMNPTITIAAPEDVEVQLAILDSKALTQSEEIRAIKCTDPDSYEQACAKGRLIATFISEVETEMERMTGEAYVFVERVRDAFRGVIKMAKNDKTYLAGEVSRYLREEERKEQERARIEKAEHDRKEQEAKIQAAVKAEEAGLTPASVERILSSPITAAPPAPRPMLQKAEGTSGRKYWKAYPKDDDPDAAKRALIVACVERPELMAYVEINQAALNKAADVFKSTFNIPGYEALAEAKTSFRKL